jgi:hypothetical protein
LHAKISRRAFLNTASRTVLAGGLAGLGLASNATPINARSARSIDPPLVWVWKFSADGELASIRDTLSANGLGMIIKTHDGTEWMERFDRSPDAIVSPRQVQRLVAQFENAGIPFHAWCVVQGNDPVTEARMCSQVLDAGARSLYLDLEPKEGKNYWQGPWENALAFGEELRRLQPNAWVTVAPDARPWQVSAVPLFEFMSFSNAVAPQSYWETFDGPANYKNLSRHGYSVGPEGVTPELIVAVGAGTFQQFGVPIQPIGQGASSPDMWRRFLASATAGGMNPISLWRYGTADPAVFGVLGQVAAQQAAQVEAAAAAAKAEAEARAQEVAKAKAAAQPAAQPATSNTAQHKSAQTAERPITPPTATSSLAAEEPAPATREKSLLEALQSQRKEANWSNRFVDPNDSLPNLQRLRRFLGQ